MFKRSISSGIWFLAISLTIALVGWGVVVYFLTGLFDSVK